MLGQIAVNSRSLCFFSVFPIIKWRCFYGRTDCGWYNSVRVSNELGAGNAPSAKFAVVVVSITSMTIGVICMAVVFATRDVFPYLFTTSTAVADLTTTLATLLGVTVLLNSLQPVLSGKNQKDEFICSYCSILPRQGSD